MPFSASHLNSLFQTASNIHTVGAALGQWFGTKKGADATGDVRKKFGVFSKDDERAVKTVIMDFPPEQQEEFVDFLGWLFDPPSSADGEQAAVMWLEAVFYSNEFFTTIAKWEQEKLEGDADNPTRAHKFVRQTLARLKTEENKLIGKRMSAERKKETAYRAVYTFLQKSPFPCNKVGETNWFAWIAQKWGVSQEFVQQVWPALAPHVYRIQREAGWWFEDRARRSDAKWRITPQVWRTADGIAWGQIMGKLVTLPRNIFIWALNKVMPF